MRLIFLVFALVFVITGSGLNSAWANREETSGSPYLVVVEDQQGQSSRKPGIYKRDSTGKWLPLIMGKVSSLSAVGQYYLPLENFKKNLRFDSLAIVDRRVHIFNINSEMSVSSSILILDGSSGQGHMQVLDPLTSQSIEVPLINTPQEFAFTSVPLQFIVSKLDKIGEVLLLSIHSPHLHGDGVTFPVFLGEHETPSSAPKVVNASHLLEGKFRDGIQLSRRILGSEKSRTPTGYLSQQVINQYARVLPGDGPEIESWRNNVHAKGENIFNLPPSEYRELPQVSIFNGETVTPKIPTLVLAKYPDVEIRYIWDPKGLLSGVYVVPSTGDTNFGFILSNVVQHKCLFLGNISHDSLGFSKNVYAEIGIYSFTDDVGGIHLIQAPSKSEPAIVNLKPPSDLEVIEKSFHIDREDQNIIASWGYKNGSSSTYLYHYILSVPESYIKIISMTEISRKYFNYANLLFRTSRHNGKTYFDTDTPALDTKATYALAHDLSSSHVDLEESAKHNTLILKSLRATKQTVLLESLKYLEYQNVKSSITMSGIYEASDEKQLVSTQVLEPIHIPLYIPGTFVLQKKRIVLLKQNIPTSIDMAIVLSDASRMNGQSNFQANLLLASKGKVFLAKLATIDYPLASLEDIEIHVPFFNNATSDQMLAYVKIKDQGVFPIPFTVSKDESLEARFTQTILNRDSFKLFSGQSIASKANILSRLRYDKNGAIYWVLTGEVSDSEPGFTIRNLITGETVNHHNMKISLFQAGKPVESNTGASSWRYYVPDLKDPVGSSQRYKTDLFSNFKNLLEDMADPRKPPQRVVMIVPEDIKQYAASYPLALYLKHHDRSAQWSRDSSGMKLFVPRDNYFSQEDVLQNFSVMEQNEIAGRSRSFFYGVLSHFSQKAKPEPKNPEDEKTFTILEPKLSENMFDEASADGKVVTDNSDKVNPHFLYLLVTEGHHVPIEKFVAQKWDHPKISSLIIATKEEWDAYITKESFEDKLNLKQYFRVETLQAPTIPVREQYVKELLARKEIQAFGYHIDVSDITNKVIADQDQAREVLARYFVKRADTLAEENQEPSFEGFVKAVGILTKELQKNTALRASLKIDRAVIQQLLSKGFTMTLNPDLLGPDDFHKKLADPQAAWKWQQKGYAGPIKFKEQMINIMRGQLNPSSTQNVASTFILNGESGTGKTQAIRSFFVDFLGLKEYNIKARDFTLGDGRTANAEAGIFILHCPSIADPNIQRIPTTNKSSTIILDEALRHIDLFFTSVHGQRGVLILDDIHDANNSVKEALLKRVRSILDQKTIEAVSAEGGELVTVPTRNITIGLTMNFKPDKDMIKKVAKNEVSPTRDELILATLSTPHAILDDSFLKRITAIVPMDIHPKDAKGPQLTLELANVARRGFLNNQVLTFVSQDVITTLVDKFPTTDVRTFMDPAEKNLLQTSRSTGNLFVTVSKISPHQTSSSGDGPREKIAHYIKDNTEKVSIENTLRGKIEFMRYMIDGSRKVIFESILKSLNENPAYAAGPVNQKNLGAPAAKAIHDHLLTIPSLPIEEMNLNPSLLQVNSFHEKNQFRSILKSIIESQRATMGFSIPHMGAFISDGLLGDSNWDSEDDGMSQRTRLKVAQETMEKIKPVTVKVMAEMLRVKSLEKYPEPEKWIESLNKSDPAFLMRDAGTAMTEALSEYIIEMYGAMVKENHAESLNPGIPKMSTYDSVRIFALAVDKVLAQMPWENMTSFMIKNLNFAVDNLDMGHASALQYLLFESKFSLLNGKHLSLVTGHAQVMPFIEQQESVERTLHKRFTTHCDVILSGLSRGSL